VATLRQARRARFPDVAAAARAAREGGADSITVHLREDRRHIQDKDVALVRKEPGLRLNLEMAATDEMVRIARVIRPDSVCLVPEKRQELTTEGGLNVARGLVRLRETTRRLRSAGIAVSLFIDPDEEQVRAAKDAGAEWVELHTGRYANAKPPERAGELAKIRSAGAAALGLGLGLNAGHGLDYDNVGPVAGIDGLRELNIGFSIVARAVFVGLETAVREMKVVGVGRRAGREVDHVRNRRVRGGRGRLGRLAGRLEAAGVPRVRLGRRGGVERPGPGRPSQRRQTAQSGRAA
jgi:pyridoxine 5-phosphate synthase